MTVVAKVIGMDARGKAYLCQPQAFDRGFFDADAPPVKAVRVGGDDGRAVLATLVVLHETPGGTWVFEGRD